MDQMRRSWLWGIVAVGLMGMQAVRAEETVQKAREILKNHQGSMVIVSALCKMDMSGTGLPVQIGGGLGEAQESSCVGMLVDQSGLTVVSYAALNPMETFGGAVSIQMGDGGPAIKPKHKISRVRIHTADGKDIPARLVFKDKELDLAFVMPDSKNGETAAAFSPLELADGMSAKELDNVVLLTRHAKHLGYQPDVGIARISSVISKPRLMYGLTGSARPGTLVFLPTGQLLGIAVQVSDEERSGLGRMMAAGTAILVLPASELLKSIEQAKKVKKPA